MSNKQEILETIYEAEVTFDEGDFDRHMALWSHRVTFESPFGDANSAEGYRTFLEAFFHQVSANGGTRHLILNPVVSFDGDIAIVRSYLQVLNRRTGAFMGTSVLTDRLKRTDAGWRFVHRKVEPDQDPSAIA